MKSLKSLLIPFIVMLVLVAIAVVVIVSNSKTSAEPSDAVTSENVLAVSSQLISSIEVVRQDGTGIGFQGTVDEVGNTLWTLMDKYDADVPLNNDGVTSWAFILSNYTSNSTIGPASELNLSEYGLDNPVFTVYIVQFDGTSDTVYIGNKTAA